MGPFVPEFISEPLNLVVALILGIAFGFVLEQAGFSSSRRLAGVFYGYDFTVLRVFFTAAVTAMSGVLLLGSAGLLDTSAIFVNPLWIKPALLGGVIMGLGFILGGYCPGTSVCAAAIGKVDAMIFVGGGLLGVLAFGELFPRFSGFYDSTARGPVQVFSSLGVSRGLFAFLLIAAAVGAFFVTTRIERRVAGDEAPSRTFPASRHLAAGGALLVLALVLAFLPDYRTRMMRKVSSPAYQTAHPIQEMDPDELAFRILDEEPQTRILDLRPEAAFAQMALPGSIHLNLEDLFGRNPGGDSGGDLGRGLAQRRVRKVILADDEAQERIAGLLLQELGYENLAILKGGFPAFDARFLHPLPFAPQGSRWDADLRAFRLEAQARIPQMIAARKASATPQPRKGKKIQGGC